MNFRGEYFSDNRFVVRYRNLCIVYIVVSLYCLVDIIDFFDIMCMVVIIVMVNCRRRFFFVYIIFNLSLRIVFVGGIGEVIIL